MWSVMGFDSSSPDEYGKVISVVPAAVLSDVTFVIRPAGAAKAQREEVKNVHAFADGTLRLCANDPLEVVKWTRGDEVGVGYDPMSEAAFVSKAKPSRKVLAAELVIAGPSGLWARGLTHAD